MAIRSKTVRLARQMRTTVGGHADDATRQLTAAWTKAWDGLATDFDTAVLDLLATAARLGRWPSPYELRRIQRLAAALARATTVLDQLSAGAVTTIRTASAAAVAAAATLEPQLIGSQFPAGLQDVQALKAAAAVSVRALDVIVARTGQQITASTKPLSAEATEAMNRALVRGVAVGDSPRASAAQMIAAVQDGFNGGLARAVNIARTEILDAYRAASTYAHQANSDVLSGWIWMCTLTARTCPACLAMNGTVHPLSEPGPLDHPSGRCVRVPKVKSWADLGIKVPEPPDSIPDARAWFAGQTPETQAQILGPGRLALLNTGAITWDQIPELRNNPSWRPSYQPRPLASLRRTASAA